MKKQSGQISLSHSRSSRSFLSFISNAVIFFRSHHRGTECPIKGEKSKFYGSGERIYCSQHISLPCSLQLHVAPLPASLLFITVSFGPREHLSVLPWPNAGVTRAAILAEASTASGTLVRVQQLTTGAIWKIDGGLCGFVCAHVPQNTALTGSNTIPLASLGLFVSLILCSCLRNFAESGPKFGKLVLCAHLPGYLCAAAAHACCHSSGSGAW